MKLATTLSTGLLVASLAALPPVLAKPVQPAAPDCDKWNTQEFFRAASVDLVKSCLNAGADLRAATEVGHTPLFVAARVSEDPAVVKALIAFGADVSEKDKQDSTPLHYAACCNENPAVIEALIEAGAGTDIEAKDDRGFTPLHRAANVNESLEVVEALVSAGADVNAPNDADIVPLQNCAFANRNPAVLETLVKAGADPMVRTGGDRTLLHLAAQNNDAAMVETVVKVLIDAGAEDYANARAGLRRSPLHFAARYNEDPSVIEALLKAGARIEAPSRMGSDFDDASYFGGTPLYDASRYNPNPEVVRALLAAGANPNSAADMMTSSTPLAMANSAEIVQLLIDAGGDPNRGDESWPDSVIYYALVYNTSKDAIAALLRAARVNVGSVGPKPLKWTPLHFARTAAAVEALTTAGANPMARDRFGLTPLHKAADRCAADAIEALVAAGADPMVRTPSGHTPLHGVGGGWDACAETVDVLVASGADPMARTERGSSPLHSAVSSNVVAALLAAGADPTSRNENGEQPMHTVGGPYGDANLSEGIEALIAAGADPMARDVGGNTPLHAQASFEAANPRRSTLKPLIAAGAEIGARNDSGDTALHQAVRGLLEHGHEVDLYAYKAQEDALTMLLEAGAEGASRNGAGQTPWDILQESDRLDDDLAELKEADVYWQLNEARFEAEARAPLELETPSNRPGTADTNSAGSAAPRPDAARCLIPGFPSPADPENQGFSWCPANVDFQVRVLAISAAGAQCAIATGSSSTPEQIAARRKETADLCTRLDALTERLGTGGGPSCRCPTDWR